MGGETDVATTHTLEVLSGDAVGARLVQRHHCLGDVKQVTGNHFMDLCQDLCDWSAAGLLRGLEVIGG